MGWGMGGWVGGLLVYLHCLLESHPEFAGESCGCYSRGPMDSIVSLDTCMDLKGVCTLACVQPGVYVLEMGAGVRNECGVALRRESRNH